MDEILDYIEKKIDEAVQYTAIYQEIDGQWERQQLTYWKGNKAALLDVYQYIRRLEQ